MKDTFANERKTTWRRVTFCLTICLCTLLLSLAGCGKLSFSGDPDSASSPTPSDNLTSSPAPDNVTPSEAPGDSDTEQQQARERVEVQQKLWEEEYYNDNDVLVLTTKFSMPSLRGQGQPRIEENYEHIFQSLMDKIPTLVEESKSIWETQEETDFYSPYYLGHDFSVEYNDNYRLSILRTISEYYGGAHGMATIFTDNFDLRTGEPISFEDIFVGGLEAGRARILPYIREEIAKNPDAYYPDDLLEDGTSMLEKAFTGKLFVLTPDGIRVYFQAYDIAPYAFGIPSFDIPYSYLEDIWKIK